MDELTYDLQEYILSSGGRNFSVAHLNGVMGYPEGFPKNIKKLYPNSIIRNEETISLVWIQPKHQYMLIFYLNENLNDAMASRKVELDSYRNEEESSAYFYYSQPTDRTLFWQVTDK